MTGATDALIRRTRDVLTANRLLNYLVVVQQAGIDPDLFSESRMALAVVSGELP